MRRSTAWLLLLILAVPWSVSAAETRAGASFGIRKLAGTHLTLYTDLAPNPDVDALPALFDQAFGQWCKYFSVDAAKHSNWHVNGYLIVAKERFITAGMFPADLPPFLSGYSRRGSFWLYDQTSPYYRRHLLLHEGTHCFMDMILKGYGPPWFSEGLAELLATHKLADGKLSLNYFPVSRREVPRLGRVELVNQDYANRKALALAKVMAYDNTAHRKNEPYGWCWAAAAFFENQPRYRDRFHQLQRYVRHDDFAQKFRRLFASDMPRLSEEWQVYVANLDYGYDFERMKLDFTPASDPPALGTKVEVASDRGWQPMPVKLEAGKKYRLKASGTYRVVARPREWLCEPGGVTLRYYHGMPLGILLAAVRPDAFDPARSSALVKPMTIGLEATIEPAQSGTLYLRINESAGRLADNSGRIVVEITPQ